MNIEIDIRTEPIEIHVNERPAYMDDVNLINSEPCETFQMLNLSLASSKRHKCKTCDKMSKLSSHERIHSGENPFAFDMCEKNALFSQKLFLI